MPIQVTLIPLLSSTSTRGLAGTFWTVWLSHSIFALPLAIFLLHNFMKEIPRELIEAARVDGAGHVKIFFRVLLPLLTPALAAFGIFQFLWVWNDLLVALTFAGGADARSPITVPLANLTGTRGTAWHLLSAGAFVSIARAGGGFLACSATSSAACWPAASRAEPRGGPGSPVRAASAHETEGGPHGHEARGHAGHPACRRARRSLGRHGVPSTAGSTRCRRPRPGTGCRPRRASWGTSPVPSAASLASGRTMAVGVVVPYITRWFFASVVQGAEAVLADAGYDVLLYDLAGRADARARLLGGRLLEKRVDAALLVTLDLDRTERKSLRNLGRPVALVGGRAASRASRSTTSKPA